MYGHKRLRPLPHWSGAGFLALLSCAVKNLPDKTVWYLAGQIAIVPEGPFAKPTTAAQAARTVCAPVPVLPPGKAFQG